MNGEILEQEARVIKVDKKIQVWVIAGESCSTCVAKKICPAAKGRMLEFDKPKDLNIKPGDVVLLEIEEKRGSQALFLTYILPFFVLMTALILVRLITGNDGLAGIAALASLVPYYLILFLLRHRFEKKFQFKIKPL